MSEWLMQGTEVAAWESSLHRTWVIVPAQAWMPPRGTWGSVGGREREGLQGGGVLVVCASFNHMHVI